MIPVTILLAGGSLLLTFFNFGIAIPDFLILTFCFTAITLLSLFIFHRGMKKEPSSRTMHIMVSVTLKMLVEMVLALLWFFVAKKTAVAALILFFVLYLTFSLFSITLMLNTLKNKSL